MKCWNCGAELEDGVSFCSRCGRNQLHEGREPVMNDSAPEQGGQTPPPSSQPPSFGGVGGGNSAVILTVFAVICLVVYGYRTITRVFTFITSVFGWLMSFTGLFYLVANLLLVVGGVWMCLMLLMVAFRRNPANSNGLILCLAGGGLVNIVARVLLLLVTLIFVRYPGSAVAVFQNLLVTVMGAVVTVGGVYAIIRFVLGESVLESLDGEALSRDMNQAFASFSQTAGEVGAQASQAAQEAQARRAAQQAQQEAQRQAAYSQNNSFEQQPGPVPPQPGYAPFHLKTDRSILAYILLNLVTCGIYGWYFIYALARDVNVVCDGDGRRTAGLVKLILLSMITCGFYQIYWMYSLGNRLASNAPRYGQNFQENGTTVLLWQFIGALLCGIGPFVAMHIIIKNTNSLCGAYNYQHGI